VKRPDGLLVEFEYDALGRRTAKVLKNKVKRYLWDGNVLLQEWDYNLDDRPQQVVNDIGEILLDKEEPVENLVTWVYEEGSFVPSGKIINDEKFSIISDYIGRPVQAFAENGKIVWEADYGIYGQVRNLKGDKCFVPFRQLGQYEDEETGLYYNRFRYYSAETGTYLSQDPIRLYGNNPNLYAYTHDCNSYVDLFGLTPLGGSYGVVRGAWTGGEVHHMPANSINGLSHYSGPAIIMDTDDHARTGSHGSQGHYGADYRAKQKAHIDNDKFWKAMEMDIDDIQSDFGKKYNKHMTEAINYAENQGYIKSSEAKKLKAKCK
jgi:RHS repeat-associated protein